MKKFIEVSTENGKFLVNVNTISCLYTKRRPYAHYTHSAVVQGGHLY